MKIWFQQPLTEEVPAVPNYEITCNGILKVLQGIARSDTEVVQHFVEKGTAVVHTDFLQMYNAKSVVESVIRAEKQGYDAVILGCWCDPGLLAARTVLNVPVIGIAEASYLYACMVGRKAAAITVGQELVPGMENTLKLYGFADRMIHRPIRAFDLNEVMGDLFIDPYRNLIPKFEKVAQECVADGADTIIAACGWLGPALTAVGYKELRGTKYPVPVIDPCAVALKLAEASADLYKTTGLLKSGSVYFRIPKSVKKSFQDNFGIEI